MSDDLNVLQLPVDHGGHFFNDPETASAWVRDVYRDNITAAKVMGEESFTLLRQLWSSQGLTCSCTVCGESVQWKLGDDDVIRPNEPCRYMEGFDTVVDFPVRQGKLVFGGNLRTFFDPYALPRSSAKHGLVHLSDEMLWYGQRGLAVGRQNSHSVALRRTEDPAVFLVCSEDYGSGTPAAVVEWDSRQFSLTCSTCVPQNFGQHRALDEATVVSVTPGVWRLRHRTVAIAAREDGGFFGVLRRVGDDLDAEDLVFDRYPPIASSDLDLIKHA